MIKPTLERERGDTYVLIMYAASRDRLLVAAGRVHPETRSRARLSRTRSEPGYRGPNPRYSALLYARGCVEYAVCPARPRLFREFSRPATSVADGRALQPGNLTQSKCRSAFVTTVRSPLAGVRCPAHHSPLTARSHALRAAKQLAAHRSVPVAPAGSASLASGVPPFPNASDQKLASYVVVASDQSLIDSRHSPGATRHLPRPSRLLHPRSHHHRRRRRRRRRRGALRGS